MHAYARSEKGIHLKNQDSFLLDLEKGLFAVADGVTVSRGDPSVASRLAVEAIASGGDLTEAALKAHERIKAASGAGTTTLTACRIRGKFMEVVHVGDSTLFLVRGKVFKVTEPDSEEGSNVIVQVLGKGEVKPHRYLMNLYEGDFILLMTDGVANHVTDMEVLEALKLPLEEVPGKLIALARIKRKLYEDDKTVVAVGI